MNANTTWSLLLVLLLLVAGQQQFADATITPPCEIPVDFSRLPTHIWPTHYMLNLELSRGLRNFEGTVEIGLQITRERNWKKNLIGQTVRKVPHPFAADPRKINLNSEGLLVTSAGLAYGTNYFNAESICHDATHKVLVITMPFPILAGQAELRLQFKGKVKKESKGLFMNVVDSSQVTLMTHFKPNHARQLFPCFDEPSFKATFQLVIKHPPETDALSNMKLSQRVTHLDIYRVTRFDATPRMSSYLLSLAVGEFWSVEKQSLKDGMKITVYAPKNWAVDVSKMHEEAVRAYDEVTEFFASSSKPQLEKIDILAVNMEPAAMENWGLISMRLDLLSAHPMGERPNDWIHAVTVMMTMMIHQRLGNFLTVSWWDDRWIQEGLAGNLANELTAKLHPEFDSELYTLVDTTFSAMNSEDQKARSIKDVDLKKAEDFDAAFDSTAYKKSVGIMRMLVGFIGEERFNFGIHNLIRRTPENGLINADSWWYYLTRKQGPASYLADIEVAHQWAKQVGYPTILVELRSKHALLVSQLPELAGGQLWPVPIVCEFHVGKKVHKNYSLLTGLNDMIHLPTRFDVDNPTHWITLNRNYRGYYRLVYSDNSLSLGRSQAVTNKQMPPVDRLQMLSDFFSDINRKGTTVNFEGLLEILSEIGETDDGVMLLLTRMLTELHGKGYPLASGDVVTTLMLKYHHQKMAVPSLLNLYTRSQVLDYLMTRLNIGAHYLE